MSVSPPTNRLDTSQLLLAPLLIGIGVMAAVDEIVFHQILAWNGAGLALLVIGLVLVSQARGIVAPVS